MIRITVFAYRGDAEVIAPCLMLTKQALPQAVLTVADDAHNPMPEEARNQVIALGARYIRTDWERQGNLNGREAIRGILNTLAEGASPADTVIKLDPDTAILRGAWLTAMDTDKLSYLGSGYEHHRAFGSCYAMKAPVARCLAQLAGVAEMPDNAPEDLTIYDQAKRVYGAERCRILPVWTPDNRGARWAFWNWDSVTASADRYAELYDVINVGNPRPPHTPPNARKDVMYKLLDTINKATPNNKD